MICDFNNGTECLDLEIYLKRIGDRNNDKSTDF